MWQRVQRVERPTDQEARFLEMAQLYAAEDEEAHPMDEDYLNSDELRDAALRRIRATGVDRLTMLLTDKDTIREVILFPHLRVGSRTTDWESNRLGKQRIRKVTDWKVTGGDPFSAQGEKTGSYYGL